MAPEDSDSVLLSPAEVSSWTTIPENTLAQYRSRGGGPPYLKLGRRVRYRRADVRRWLDDHARIDTRRAAS